jgi:gluconolactonase
LKYTPGGAFETLIPDAGTNGLAVNAAGQLVAASHAVGGIVTFDPTSPAAPPVTVSALYGGSRFNSPNDLTIRSDGTIYFTDPDWQCQNCGHQPVKGVYRIPPGGAPELLTVLQDNPNGIALSPDESVLYVGGNSLASYPVNGDGTIGAGAAFGEGFFGSTDGLGMDCAGNLYVTTNGTVTVFSSAGANLGQIAADGVTNVAFGDQTSTTLYIVGFGSPGKLRSVQLNVPGFPY